MPGMLDWKIKISADIKDLQNKMHKVEGELGEFEGKDHKVKLDLDTKTLESALKKLDSMLDSLGKGTGDFKQFETLSKDLAKVTSELSGFTKAFGKIDNSGTKSLLDMVQNIDKSLNNLSNHVTDEFLNKITSSVGTVKQKFADIGDGSEFEPLLQMINKIDSSINNLAKETSKIKLNMNLDFGTEMSEKMNQQVSKAVSRQAQAYKNLFETMKGSGKTTEEMIKFSLPENASNSEIVGAYKGVIERAEKQYGKSTYSLRLGSKYNDAKNEVKNANAALRRAEIKRTNSNGVSDLLGGNFGDAINELSKIAAKLDEISSSASGLKSAFETGFNVSASVEEIAQLTNKVKKLEDELQKVKSVSSGTVSTGVTLGNESNISSEVSSFQQQEKIQNQVTQSIQEQNKAIDESIKKTLTLNDVRQKQWEIIQKTNPKEEGTNSTWVDKPEDAKTFYEVNHKDSDYPFNENYSDDWTVKDKMNVEATGKITVYSSYPIEDGNWVTPSKEEGLSYAGSGKLYSATMDPRDIAWVDAGQGQVAHISDELKEVIDLSTKAETQVQSIDNNTNKTGEQSTLNALDDTIAKYETIVSLVKEYYDLSNNKKNTIGISSDDERISEIRKQLKSYTKNPDYNGEYKMGFGGSGKNIFAKSVDLSQEEMLQEICNMLGVEIPKNADKAKEAIKEVASAATTEQKKDAFSDSSNNTKPETEGMEQVEKATEEAVQAKKDFATANEGVQSSIDGSENPLKLEAELMEQIAKSAREAADAKKEFVEANKQVKDSADESNSDLKAKPKKEQNANINLNKYDKRLDSYNGKVDKYQATIDRFNDGGWTSDEYLKNVQAVRDAVKQYATLLDNIKTNQNGIASDEDIQNLDKYEKKIKDTIATVTNMSAAEKGYNFVSGQKELDKIHKLLAENTKMSAEAKAKIKSYYAEIESGNPSMSLDKIHGEIMKIVNAEKEAGRAGKSMWSAIKEKAWYGAASAIGTYFGVNDIFRYGKEIADIVIQLDTATTELRKVSDATDQRLATNFKNSAKTAKQLGSTISDVISATADWSRMGYDIDQAEELARVSTLYKNVGDGIDIETANNSLISTLQGFQLDASQAESIIDKFNEVANNYAIDSAGIGEALQRSAASFNAANTDLSKSIALITATNEVVQDPDSVGTLWKTMSARIRGAETELSELNEETDEYTKTTSKLRDLIKNLTGFDIMADEDTFKDIYDIILGIGKEWNNLTDAEQSSLGEALAGKRNANALYAVLGNIDTLQSAYKTAENSAGSAQREQENYQKSIQYSIDQTKAKLEELSADFLSSDFLKGAIDAGGKLIDILDNIVKSGNAIPAVATAIAAAFSFKNVGFE